MALILGFAVLAAMGIAFLGFPRISNVLVEAEERHMEEQAKILADGLLPFVLQNQFAGIYETLEAVLEQQPNWKQAILRRPDGSKLYPLFEVPEVTGDKLLHFTQPLEFQGEVYAELEVTVDISPVIQGLINEQIRIASILAVLYAVSMIVFGVLLDKLVGRRIRLLMIAAQRLARGNFKAKLPPRSRDEIGDLTESFASMRQQIFDKEQSLIQARIEAESAAIAKSQFLATMSHEIRTPLNGVIPVADLLLESELDQRQRRFVQTIHTSGRALKSIIDDILDLSKIEVGKLELRKEAFEMAELLHSVEDMLRIRATNSGLELIVRQDEGATATFEGDEDRLRQVLVNLVGNSIKFTDTGSITIDVRSRDLGDNISRLEFRVVDTGIGIPEDKFHTIFERFSQVDSSDTRKVEGTGLGLSICKAIIDVMGGKIGVNSTYGEGSTFWFVVDLPHLADLEAEPEQADTSDELSQDRELNILIADDNMVNRLVTSEMVRLLGHEATAVESGAAAIESVQEHNFDLILMDVQMPDIDGLTATRAIRNLQKPCATIPIIGYSASAFASDQERCMNSGMSGFLAKPLSHEKLKDMLVHLNV